MASTHTIDAVPPSVEADLHAETATPAEHGSGGLPQFQFEHWAGQIGYLLILFVILYVLVSKVFAPRLRKVMDERADTISTAVATARQVQAEAADQQQHDPRRRDRDHAPRQRSGDAAGQRDRLFHRLAGRYACRTGFHIGHGRTVQPWGSSSW